jgi:osmotically-inducible protein OsmY
MSENHEGGQVFAWQEQKTQPSKEKVLVLAEAQSRLRKSHYRELDLVACEFYEGVLTLRGRVSTFYLKQLAQTLVLEMKSVGEINNRLEVAVSPAAP